MFVICYMVYTDRLVLKYTVSNILPMRVLIYIFLNTDSPFRLRFMPRKQSVRSRTHAYLDVLCNVVRIDVDVILLSFFNVI